MAEKIKDKGNGKDKKEKITTMTYEGPKELTPTEMDMGTEIAKAEQQSEIMFAIMGAKKFPRNEIQCNNQLLAVCDMEEFAGGAYYSFPRGKYQDEKTGEWKTNIVSGASIKMAREAFRIYGNLRVGFFITHDNEDNRGIVAWAWDMEKNNRMSSSDYFSKMIKRDGKMETANERDLREMTARRASILLRNCILSLLPGYMTDKFVAICKRTAAGGEKTDLKERIVMMQNAFLEIGISSTAIGNYLGKPITACTREDLGNLRGIHESLKDGMIQPNERQEMFGDPLPPEQRRGAVMDTTDKKPLSEQSMKATTVTEPEKRDATKKGITDGQRRALFAACKSSGKNQQDLKNYMKENFNLESTKDLNEEQYKDLLDYASWTPIEEEKKPAATKTAAKKTPEKKNKVEDAAVLKQKLLADIKKVAKKDFQTLKQRVIKSLGTIHDSADLLEITRVLNAKQVEFTR